MAAFWDAAGARRRGGLAAAGTLLGLCAITASPLMLTGCGSGSRSSTASTGGTDSSSNLGRAAVVIGDYTATQTLANGKTEETSFDFIPGSSFETVAGSYTRRVLSARSDGGSDYVSFSSGTLTGNILANGQLHVLLTPDDDAFPLNKSVATRQTDSDEYNFTIGQGGTTIADASLKIIANKIQQIIQTYKAISLAGTWSGSPSGQGGFQLDDPRSDTPIGPITGISFQYSTTGGPIATAYTAALTLTDPTSGQSYTASGVQAHLYSQYDTKLPDNFSGITKLDAGQFFVVGKGNLPASAGALTIPNVPVVGTVSIPLANRAFLFEAGGGTYNGSRIQLGTLYLKIDSTDPLYALLPFAGLNPDATSGYIPVGSFVVFNGTVATPSPTPSPSPSPGQPSVGTIQFSNVSATNATTTTITQTEAAAEFQGNILNASLTESGDHTIVRVLSMQLGAPDDSYLAVGKTFAISPNTTVANGQARVSYVEEGGSQKFWDAQSGSVVVVAHDSQHTTLRVINAAMTPLNNYGSSEEPIGTFTINATGKF